MVLAEAAIGQSRKLMTSFSRHAEHLPRAFKSSHGDRVISRSVMSLDCVVEATSSNDSDASALLEKATSYLDKLRTIVQECLDDGVFDRSKHSEVSSVIEAVEQTLICWSQDIASAKAS